MSKRVLAPILLLLAAAGATAAIFAVHEIEKSGGPLAEPHVTEYFSPGHPSAQDRAAIRFTTRRPERVSIELHRCTGGSAVREIVANRRVDGPVQLSWDGTNDAGKILPDGCYQVEIRRAGDPRRYEPARPTHIDTRAPVAAVDRSAIKDGFWNGLLFTEPGVHLEYRTEDGTQLDRTTLDATVYTARAGHSSGTAKRIRPPRGTQPYRFSVHIGAHSRRLLLTAVDGAGNATPLPPDLFDHAERLS